VTAETLIVEGRYSRTWNLQWARLGSGVNPQHTAYTVPPRHCGQCHQNL